MDTENLLVAVKSLITPDLISKASTFLSESGEKTQLGFMSAIPNLLMGLVNKGSSHEGARGLLNMIQEDNYDSGVPSNYLDHLKGGKATEKFLLKGQDALAGIFGDQLGSIRENIVSKVGISGTSMNKILSFTAPLVMGVLGSKVKKYGFNPAALMELLSHQKSVLAGLSSAIPQGLTAASFGTKKQPEIVETKVEPKVERPVERLRDYDNREFRTYNEEIPSSRTNGKGARWLPLLLAALLIGGGGYLVTNRSARDTTRNQEGTQQQAGTAEEQQRTTEVPAEHPQAVEQISEYLDSGTDSELPKRFTLDHLNFPAGSAELTTESGQTLDEIATSLKNHPSARIRLEGYSDNSGTAEVNRRLTSQRAEAVKKALVDRGIDAERISTAGLGSSNPVASNATEEGRLANRRTVLIIVRR